MAKRASQLVNLEVVSEAEMQTALDGAGTLDVPGMPSGHNLQPSNSYDAVAMLHQSHFAQSSMMDSVNYLDFFENGEITIRSMLKGDSSLRSAGPKKACDLKKIPNPDYKLSYTQLAWIIISMGVLIAVLDRFTSNVWPLWFNQKGPWRKNWAISMFVVCTWITGRVLLVSSPVMMVTMCRAGWDWCLEKDWFPSWLRVGSIMEENNNLHWHTGWALLGIPVLIHAWVIIFPAWAFGGPMKIINGMGRPTLDNGEELDFVHKGKLSLTINDFLRLATTTLAVLVFFPISMWRKPRQMSFNFAMALHIAGALVYLIDLLRVDRHRNVHVFDSLFIAAWIADRIIGVWWYKSHDLKVVRKQKLDEKTIVLFLQVPTQYAPQIGDLFYFQFQDSWLRAHPYTCFANHKGVMDIPPAELFEDQAHAGHKFQIMTHTTQRGTTHTNMVRADTDDLKAIREAGTIHDEMGNTITPPEWNVGVLVNVYPKHDDCFQQTPFTLQLMEKPSEEETKLHCWGPYRSGYRVLCDLVLYEDAPPLVLIGTGTGAAYPIDFVNFIKAHSIELRQPVQVYITSASRGLFQFVTNCLCHDHYDNLIVTAHLTRNDKIKYNPDPNQDRDSRIGRASFEEVLDKAPKNAEVFFCGAPKLEEMVREHCEKLGLFYHRGHSF